MKAKLIKKGYGYYLTHLESGWWIGDTDHEKVKQHKGEQILSNLSLKNCQAIERGYDLDELAEKACPDVISSAHSAYKAGFQKLLEILGDKKFSEEQMLQAFLKGVSLQIDAPTFQQSLQQTEWDVEIEMEEVSIGDKYTPEPKPKLDADGCLILTFCSLAHTSVALRCGYGL